MITRFTENSIIQLRYYVYILVDPRNNEVFYVGKGSGNRVFMHESEDRYGEKNSIITNIQESGAEVKKYIVYSGMNEAEAFAVEAGIINLINTASSFHFTKLTNEQTPHNTFLPCLTVDEYDAHYSGKSLEMSDFPDSEKMMLVNLKTKSMQVLYSQELIRNKLLFFGSISGNQERPLVLLPVFRGFIVGAYTVLEWKVEEQTTKRTTRQYYVPNTIEINDALSERYSHKCVSSIMKPNSQKHKIVLFGKTTQISVV